MKKLIITFLSLIFLTIMSFGQTTFKGGDMQTWASAYLKYQFNLMHSTTFRLETRATDNFSQYKHFSGELKYAFHPARSFMLGAGFRYIRKPEMETENKFFTDLHFFYKGGSFSIAYRLRPQYEYTPPYGDNTASDDWQLRNKFWVKYDSLGKFTPYLAAEIRYQVAGNNRPQLESKFHRARWEAGAFYSINCKNSVALFGLVQHEWNLPVEDQKVIYVIGLTYFYKIAWKLCEDEHIKFDASE